jgi:Gas vesicle synthesis protein GvpL/GvpF
VLLVHGVLHDRDRDRASVERLGAGPVRARPIVTGALAAVVSAAPEQGLTPDDAVAHLELLVALVTAVPVLPLPLGTTAPDDDAVREEVLAPAAEQLERLLAAVADLVELRLDLAFDTDATVADIARGDPAIERLVARSRAPGAGLAERMALGEAIAGRVADVQTELAEEWTAELAGVAERSVVLAADEQIRRTAYLVRRDRLADADAAVVRLHAAAAGRAGVEYVGPLPVYSFLDDFPADPEPAARSRWGW